MIHTHWSIRKVLAFTKKISLLISIFLLFCSYISQAQVPTVTVNSPAFCSNGSPQLIKATPGNGLSTDYDYTWTVPTGANQPGNVSSFQPTVSGNYSVVIKNKSTGISSTSVTGTVTINNPPSITLHPSENVICRNNQAAVFISDATGSPTPSVQWQVSTDNGTSWSSLVGETNKTYTFTPGNTDDKKKYRAIYTNSCGSAFTNPALLIVGSGVNFPKDLDGQYACNGASATLLTKITGGVGLTGTLTFFWERSPDGIAWALIPNTTQSHPASGEYEPSYSPQGNETNYFFRLGVSNNGCVTYTNGAKVVIYPKPIANKPSDIDICNNTTVSVNFTGANVSYYTWTNNNIAIGLGSNGSGNLNFTALNSTTNPINGNIIVTPYYVGEFQTCPGTPVSFNITVNPQPDINFVTTNVSCNGGNNGTATANVTVGSMPFSYTWNTNPVQTTPTAINLGAGTYSVTITDSKGCTRTKSTVITQPSALDVSGLIGDVNCFGQFSGAINITATGGTSPYTYDWADMAGVNNSEDRTNLPAGNYTVIVTDSKGCTINKTFTINQPSAILDVSANPGDLNCFGQSNGVINITVTGGTPPYNYDWTDIGGSANTEDRSNLTAGSYTVIVTDSRGCVINKTFVIAQPPSALNLFASSSDPGCFGESTGAINITVTGGTPPYNYDWVDIGGSNNIRDRNSLPAGNYSVIITDSKGCTINRTFLILQPAIALDVSGITGDVNCFGQFTGSINITATGGTPPYTYDWADIAGAVNAEDRTGLAAGNYTVIITDSKGCTISKTFTVNQPASILDVSGTLVEVKCFNQASGAINITVTGGSSPYNYDWTDLGGSNNIEDRNGLVSGNYTSIVTDSKGCTLSKTFTINQPASSLSASIDATNVSCNGEANGLATVEVSGGTAPYSYLWNTGDVVNSINGLNVGTYSVVVTDANGCTANDSHTITQPPAINVSTSTSVTHVACNGSNGTINLTVNASGGTPPLTKSFLWSNGATTQNLSGLTAGIYNVGITITDANNCASIFTTSASIDEPSGISALITSTPILCNGGSSNISVTASGGSPGNGSNAYLYSLDGTSFISAAVGNSVTFSNKPAGNYTIYVKDGNGCIKTFAHTITAPPIINVSASAQPILCNGGNTTIIINATGGTGAFQYSINGTAFQSGNTFIRAAGSYTVTVKDANGCIFSTTASVSNSTAPTAIALTPGAASCGQNNGTLTLGAVTGGTAPYTYSIDGAPYSSTTSYTALAAGSHTVDVKDANGCIFSTTASVSNMDEPEVTFKLIHPNCIEPTGIMEITSPTQGLQFSIDGSNYAPYSVDGFKKLTSGRHNIQAKNEANCETTFSITINEKEPAVPYEFIKEACNSYTLPWGEIATSTKDYVHVYKTTTGCDSVVTAHIVINISEVPRVNVVQPTCSVATGIIAITSPKPATDIRYSIDGINYANETGVFDNLNPGNYNVTVKNTSGCISEATTVSINAQSTDPKLVITNPKEVCGVGSVDLTEASITGGSEPGLQYSYWRNSDASQPIPDPKNVTAATYYIKATTAGGCYTIKPVVVLLSSAPNATISGKDICLGDNTSLTIQLNGQPPFSLTYDDGSSTQTITNITTTSYQISVSPTRTTTYRIQRISDALCVNNNPNASVTINISEAAKGLRYSSSIAQVNKPIQLNARFFGNNYTYKWGPEVGLNDYKKQQPLFNYDRPTEYTIAITSNSGCITIDTLLVKMAEELPREGLYSDLFVPKAWTPNSDGHNDKLFPLTVNIKQLLYFRVFDRWGQLMFQTNEMEKGWDGMIKGKPQVMDVYTWTVEAIGEDGKHFKRSGNSVLLR